MGRIQQPWRCGGKSRWRRGGNQAPSGRCDDWRESAAFDRVRPTAWTMLRKESDPALTGGLRIAPCPAATEQFRTAAITRNAGKDGGGLPWLTVIFCRAGAVPLWM